MTCCVCSVLPRLPPPKPVSARAPRRTDQLSKNPWGCRTTARGVKMVDPSEEFKPTGEKGSDIRAVDDDWLANKVLEMDDSDYPTSRSQVIMQAASSGDVKGFVYAASSGKVLLGALVLSYLSFASAGTFEDGPVASLAGLRYPALLVALGLVAIEVRKFQESVLGFESRRKM